MDVVVVVVEVAVVFVAVVVVAHAIFEPGTTLKKISKNLVTGSQKYTPS